MKLLTIVLSIALLSSVAVNAGEIKINLIKSYASGMTKDQIKSNLEDKLSDIKAAGNYVFEDMYNHTLLDSSVVKAFEAFFDATSDAIKALNEDLKARRELQQLILIKDQWLANLTTPHSLMLKPIHNMSAAEKQSIKSTLASFIRSVENIKQHAHDMESAMHPERNKALKIMDALCDALLTPMKDIMAKLP